MSKMPKALQCYFKAMVLEHFHSTAMITLQSNNAQVSQYFSQLQVIKQK